MAKSKADRMRELKEEREKKLRSETRENGTIDQVIEDENAVNTGVAAPVTTLGNPDEIKSGINKEDEVKTGTRADTEAVNKPETKGVTVEITEDTTSTEAVERAKSTNSTVNPQPDTKTAATERKTRTRETKAPKDKAYKGGVPSSYLRGNIPNEANLHVPLSKEAHNELKRKLLELDGLTIKGLACLATDVFIEIKTPVLKRLLDNAETRKVSIGTILNEILPKYLKEYSDVSIEEDDPEDGD